MRRLESGSLGTFSLTFSPKSHPPTPLRALEQSHLAFPKLPEKAKEQSASSPPGFMGRPFHIDVSRGAAWKLAALLPPTHTAERTLENIWCHKS